MTITLHNGRATFQISRNGWGKLMELGQRHGWQPAGTEPPQWDVPHMQAAYADWHGVYTSVTDADARALAAALATALSGLPAFGADTPETNQLLEDGEHGGQPSAANLRRPSLGQAPSTSLAGKTKAQVIEFVAFARQGRFSILCGPEMHIDKGNQAEPA